MVALIRILVADGTGRILGQLLFETVWHVHIEQEAKVELFEHEGHQEKDHADEENLTLDLQFLQTLLKKHREQKHRYKNNTNNLLHLLINAPASISSIYFCKITAVMNPLILTAVLRFIILGPKSPFFRSHGSPNSIQLRKIIQ